MLELVHLKNFQCFDSKKIPLSKLNILSGINGSGKTSFLRALGALSQTISETNSFDHLLLNGQIVKIGYAHDAINRISNQDDIEFHICFNDEGNKLVYHAANSHDFTLEGKTIKVNDDFKYFFKNVTYISAERLSPREMPLIQEKYSYNGKVGIYGQYTINVILDHQDIPLREDVCKSSYKNILNEQLDAYLSDIFPNIKLKITPIKNTNSASFLSSNCERLGYLRPENITNAVSYVLPIYVSCLTMKPEGLIIIENPEKHLHPKAQSILGTFLAKIATSGLQCIIETHSDHIINGIRKAVKSQILTGDDVTILFFKGLDENGHLEIVSPAVRDNGLLTMWPENFCDQYDNDIEELIDW